MSVQAATRKDQRHPYSAKVLVGVAQHKGWPDSLTGQIADEPLRACQLHSRKIAATIRAWSAARIELAARRAAWL